MLSRALARTCVNVGGKRTVYFAIFGEVYRQIGVVRAHVDKICAAAHKAGNGEKSACNFQFILPFKEIPLFPKEREKGDFGRAAYFPWGKVSKELFSNVMSWQKADYFARNALILATSSSASVP